jgi:hypothetical protein
MGAVTVSVAVAVVGMNEAYSMVRCVASGAACCVDGDGAAFKGVAGATTSSSSSSSLPLK